VVQAIVGGGGVDEGGEDEEEDDEELDTVTEMAADVRALPAVSRATARTAWAPLPVLAVFQLA
jgi:hypothetical protein